MKTSFGVRHIRAYDVFHGLQSVSGLPLALLTRNGLKPWAGSKRFSSSTEVEQKDGKNLEYCMSLVKRYDERHYLCGNFMPSREARRAHFVLRAFNVELALIRDAVDGNRDTGRIRIQWWREAVDSIYSNAQRSAHPAVAGHPVIASLKREVNHHNLTRRFLDRMIDAREADLLNDAPFESIEAAETYAENTESCLVYLGLETAGVREDDADHTASHIGKAIGLSTLLYAIPPLCSKGIVRIPQQVLERHGIGSTDVLQFASQLASQSQAQGSRPARLSEHEMERLDQAIVDCVFDVASVGNAHIGHARELSAHLKRDARKALLCATPAAQFYRRLEQVNFQVFSTDLRRYHQLDINLLNKMRIFKNGVLGRF